MSDPTLALMLEAAMAAAIAINDVYAAPFTAEYKGDGSPVTEADGRAELIILEHLKVTGLPVLAEESAAAGRIPALDGRFFVVDPLDGTKEFIKRNGEFTVNIALVEAGRPVLGVVLAPVTGEAFLGEPAGAYQCATAGRQAGSWLPIRVRDKSPPDIVASRSHGHSGLETLCAEMATGDNVSVGSSLKFCLLAQGTAQLYPRFTPTCEWDTAAGQAVLEAAGGAVLAIDGQPLRYGKRERDFLNPFFVAADSRSRAETAAAIMRAVVGGGD